MAQQAKNHGEVRQVFVCSVTPRKDMGSFIFSRSESVNNRLRSLCSKTDIKFIDLREKLEVCKFNGLFKDAVHYNKAGATEALRVITDTVKHFLA